jgi:hypothetical protein
VSLPPNQWGNLPTYYRVIQPFGVNTGTAASYYGLQGGGTQYWFMQPIQKYIDMGLLEQIFP